MSDVFTTLNVGAGGNTMDETGVTFGTDPVDRRRPRVVIGGDTPEALVPVLNAPADDASQGLVVRTLPGNKSHPGTGICWHQAVTLVPSGADTTVCSYVVAAGKTFLITGWYISGDVNAKYTLLVNSIAKAVLRTTSAKISDAAVFNIVHPEATEGQSIIISVNHSAAGIQANFDATILGYILPV